MRNPKKGKSLIKNCESYSHDGKILKCIGCLPGYYLKSDSEFANNPTQG